jgi:predicted transcriptional regulator
LREEPISLQILRSLQEKEAANPGDIVMSTGLPRYLVLAAFQILEELGFIKLIYHRGSHKVYKLSEKGEEYLSEAGLSISVKEDAKIVS